MRVYKTSTTRVTQDKATPQPAQDKDTGAKPKFTFVNPGVSPVPRWQHILNLTQPNTSYIAQPLHIPKLPFFSGSEDPQKGECS